MSLSAMCRNKITVMRQAKSRDLSGGQVPGGWAVVSSSLTEVRVSIQPITAFNRNTYAQNKLVVTEEIYGQTDLESLGAMKGDRLDDEKGRSYVLHGFGDFGGQGRVFVCYVERIL